MQLIIPDDDEGELKRASEDLELANSGCIKPFDDGPLPPLLFPEDGTKPAQLPLFSDQSALPPPPIVPTDEGKKYTRTKNTRYGPYNHF